MAQGAAVMTLTTGFAQRLDWTGPLATVTESGITAEAESQDRDLRESQAVPSSRRRGELSLEVGVGQGDADAVAAHYASAIMAAPRAPDFSLLTTAMPQPELVGATQELLPAGWRRTAEVSQHHRVVLVMSGTMHLVSPAGELQVNEGEALLLPAGTHYEEFASDTLPLKRVCVAFHWPHMGSLSPEESGACVVTDGANRLRDLVQWLVVERQATFSESGEYRVNLLRLIVSECRRLTLDDSGALEKRIRAYSLEHVSEPITLAELALHVGMGRFHLCRKYRELTGETPMHAVRTVRLERARDLIRSTTLPLRGIAKRVGLRSEQHLSRLLNLHFGMGVKELRAGTSSQPKTLIPSAL
jgi:AraC-like DNA-binding protein/mannose-6-phosphate isomerase-like protein (cupin superfamily)